MREHSPLPMYIWRLLMNIWRANVGRKVKGARAEHKGQWCFPIHGGGERWMTWLLAAGLRRIICAINSGLKLLHDNRKQVDLGNGSRETAWKSLFVCPAKQTNAGFKMANPKRLKNKGNLNQRKPQPAQLFLLAFTCHGNRLMTSIWSLLLCSNWLLQSNEKHRNPSLKKEDSLESSFMLQQHKIKD